MKIDVNKQITDLDGQPLTMSGKDGEMPLTVGTACRHALLNAERPNDTGEKRFERYCLAERITNPDAEYTAKDVALIREIVGQSYKPLVVGPIWRCLDG